MLEFVLFTLMYRGRLPGSGSARDKHDIRRALHPQIKELWTHPPLDHYANWLAPANSNDVDAGSAIRRTGGHAFAVLVINRFKLVVELDVLLLRPEHPGQILQRADIDNRLKTLFDALRYPDKNQEILSTWSPTAAEQPLYCLLEDDRLITRINVESDRLLNASSVDEVFLIVRVRLHAWSPTWATVSLIS